MGINLKPKEWYENYFQSNYENENELDKRIEKEMITDNLIDKNIFESFPNSFHINYYINSNDLEDNEKILEAITEFFSLNYVIKCSLKRYQMIIERLILLKNILNKGYLITQQLEFFISFINGIYQYISKKDRDFFNFSLDYSHPIRIAIEYIKELNNG